MSGAPTAYSWALVPLRGSSTEGLSGQFTIGATDSYNARVADGLRELMVGGKESGGQGIDNKEKSRLRFIFGFCHRGLCCGSILKNINCESNFMRA